MKYKFDLSNMTFSTDAEKVNYLIGEIEKIKPEWLIVNRVTYNSENICFSTTYADNTGSAFLGSSTKSRSLYYGTFYDNDKLLIRQSSYSNNCSVDYVYYLYINEETKSFYFWATLTGWSIIGCPVVDIQTKEDRYAIVVRAGNTYGIISTDNGLTTNITSMIRGDFYFIDNLYIKSKVAFQTYTINNLYRVSHLSKYDNCIFETSVPICAKGSNHTVLIDGKEHLIISNDRYEYILFPLDEDQKTTEVSLCTKFCYI